MSDACCGSSSAAEPEAERPRPVVQPGPSYPSSHLHAPRLPLRSDASAAPPPLGQTPRAAPPHPLSRQPTCSDEADRPERSTR